MKESNPLVTVCIPTYNSSAFIKQTVETILKQTYKNIIVKVIDNCSTDDTRDIVESIDDERVVLIKNETNVGMTGNFNKCLDYAEGKYLQIICSDDKIANNCIEEKVKAFENNADCSLVFSATEVRDENEKILMKRNPFHNDKKINGLRMFKKAFRNHNLYGEPSNVMMKVDCIKEAGYFDPKMYYAVDWEYWSRFSLTGNVYYINKPLAYFYIRNTSETGMLLNKKEEIVNDDKLFVDICKSNSKMKVDFWDVLSHNFNGKIRLFMKIVFAKIKR